VLRARQEAKAYDLSLVEAAEVLPLADGLPSGDTSAAHACDSDQLQEAVHGLALRSPEFSASSGLWGWQSVVLASLATIVCAGVLAAAEATFVALPVLLAIPFLFVVALRAVALWHFFNPPVLERAACTARLEDEYLPLYSVLVPLFGEAAIVPDLVRALRAIDYPAHKLQVLLIVESIDLATQAALRSADLSSHMRVLVVPDGAPRTNPRACQYALQLATGAYIVVYDAEDWPDPGQLRRALSLFCDGPERLGCLQAQLNIYNSNTSWLTRQFTIEYTALFDCILPTLGRLKLPVPLGGTSNHFPRTVLNAVGGWDPFNVTEDADLGIRLARSGWQVGVLPSATWEEAPSTFRVWLGQRTRWLKGWIQTYLVQHARAPSLLARARCAALRRPSSAHGWPYPIGACASLVLRATCLRSLARTAFDLARIGVRPVAVVDWRLQSHRRLRQRHMARNGCFGAPRQAPAIRPRCPHAALLACNLACRLSGTLAVGLGALLLGEDGAFRANARFRAWAAGIGQTLVTSSPVVSNMTVRLR